MRIRETMAAGRPPAEIYAALAEPDRRGDAAGWSSLSRSGNEYTGVLHASAGAIALDFDCRFEVVETDPEERVRLRGVGTSPRLGFTFDALLEVQAADAGSRVAVDADIAVSGALAGLGQRRLAEQARKLLAAYIEAA
jgi:carbon monoxide dehydrogenase subunit G